jgi:hypothetical protein
MKNPTDPQAATLIHLISLKHNPHLAKMSQEELIELVKKLAQPGRSPQEKREKKG